MTGNSVLLDSSVIVRHFRNAEAVSDKLAAFEELYVPQTALGELYYGAFKSARTEENLGKIERFLVAAYVLGTDNETALQYGKIAAQLARDGTPVPQNDIWIAAVAVQCGVLLATTDGHFRRFEGLDVLFW
ncbi:MAG: type II toxin-antitoxin system VapC family toxin [Verrucomicrobia bacterium]|nr:type II toxin-antitoxin system VapC family toxin [Verrucomicrobiota bacterium]